MVSRLHDSKSHLFDPTCIHLDSDYIDDWWEEHGENLIEDKWGELGNSGPYEIDPTHNIFMMTQEGDLLYLQRNVTVTL